MKEIDIEDLILKGEKVFIPLADNVNTKSFVKLFIAQNPGLRLAKHKVGLNKGRMGIWLWIDRKNTD